MEVFNSRDLISWVHLHWIKQCTFLRITRVYPLLSVKICGENLTATSEQKEYEIVQPDEGRDCDFTISAETPGNGITVRITDGGGVNGTYIPGLCHLVEVTITTSELKDLFVNIGNKSPYSFVLNYLEPCLGVVFHRYLV